MNKAYYIVVDTETGGLDEKATGLLSLAWALYDNDGKLMDKHYETCRPEVVDHETCTPKALSVNGFTLEEIAMRETIDTETARRFWDKVDLLATNLDDQLIWVGQNAPFDIRFMMSKSDKFVLDTRGNWVPMPSSKHLDLAIIDTKTMIRDLRNRKGRPSSSTAFANFIVDFPEVVSRAVEINKEVFGVEDAGHHDARFDVSLCVAIMEE